VKVVMVWNDARRHWIAQRASSAWWAEGDGGKSQMLHAWLPEFTD
jgi:hypothetical protein